MFSKSDIRMARFREILCAGRENRAALATISICATRNLVMVPFVDNKRATSTLRLAWFQTSQKCYDRDRVVPCYRPEATRLLRQ